MLHKCKLPKKAEHRAGCCKCPQKDEAYKTDDGERVVVRLGRSPGMSQQQAEGTCSYTLYASLLDDKDEIAIVQGQQVVAGPHEVVIPRHMKSQTEQLLAKQKERIINQVLRLRDLLEGEEDLPEVEPF